MTYSPMEDLRQAVSLFDASLKGLVSSDEKVREEAILDAASLLTAAKAVVLEA